jgi:predicted metalloprotease
VNRFVTAAVAVASTAVLISGCTRQSESKPQLAPPNPDQIAGAPVANGPSGVRPNAPGPTRPIENTGAGDIDMLAGLSIADVEEFWTGAYATPLKGKFTPVNAVFSWDSRYKHGKFCGEDIYGFINAMWCGSDEENCPSAGPPACSPSNDTIGWDRGVLLPDERDIAGDLGVTLVLAHEYGHAITWAMADLLKGDSRDVAFASEQQADCFAGVYMRWVVDGKSKRFTLSNGDGLTKMLIGMIGLRDPLVAQGDPKLSRLYHGSAFERITAFQFGFNQGAAACASIDVKEVRQRRKNLPKDFLSEGSTGEYPISEESVGNAVAVLTKLFSPADPPQLSFEQAPCADAKAVPPASYCPSTNTLNVDMNRLILMGTSLNRGSPLDLGGATSLHGDYTAYAVLVSRFMMAVEKQRGGLSLNNTDAGLRTACLTGVATTKLSEDVTLPDGRSFILTGGDLDEAVTGLLNNGLAASDVNGAYAPSAFARVDAFRTGVLGDEDSCYKRWP